MIERRSVLVLTAGLAIVLAAVAASCGGQSESKPSTAAVGAALPGIERITETGVYDSAAYKVVGTSCPEGKKLIGAGGRIRAESGPPGWIGTLQSGQVGLTRFGPTDTLNGVIVAGAELNPNHLFNWAVQSYGICETETAKHELEYVDHTSDADSESRKYVAASCPPGKGVLGGGGAIVTSEPDRGKVGLWSIRYTLTFTSVVAVELGAGTINNWRVTAYSVCGKNLPQPSGIFTNESAADSAHDKYVFVDCPSGQKVVGAGGAIKATEAGAEGAVALTGIGVHGGPIPRVSAFAAETGNGTSAAWSVSAIANCRAA